ncbi:MAG: glycine cleavage T C-terminal barrel domain-containing protein, partial [Gemmatimonadales bacterium]
IKAAGVARKLVGVEIAGPRLEFNATKWPVLAGARAVGQVTSAIHSPRLEKNIGYAMVPVGHAELGTSLVVAIPQVGERAATVVPKPFVDPRKAIPRA